MIVNFAEAQNQDTTSTETEWLVTALESMPDFDDGYKKLSDLIKSNLRQPYPIREEKKVYVKCLVDTLGFTHCHEVLKHTDSLLDEEALRVCRLIKFDKPAKQSDKPVNVDYIIPVTFLPESTEHMSVCIQDDNCINEPCGTITNILATYNGITFQTTDTVFVWPIYLWNCSTAFFINGYYISDTLLEKLKIEEKELVKPNGTKYDKVVSWFVPEYCNDEVRDCYKHIDCFFFTKLPMIINGKEYVEKPTITKDDLTKKGIVVSAYRKRNLFKEDKIILEVK